jgi:hypothetical protein
MADKCNRDNPRHSPGLPTIRVIDGRSPRAPAARTNRFLTLLHLGPVFASGIPAEIGDIIDFPTTPTGPVRQSCVAPTDSRHRTNEVPPLAWTGHAPRRHAPVETANSVRRHDATCAVDYRHHRHRKLAAGTQPTHHRPLVLTARQRSPWSSLAGALTGRTTRRTSRCARDVMPKRPLHGWALWRIPHPASDHPWGSTGVFGFPVPASTLGLDLYTSLYAINLRYHFPSRKGN